MDELFDLQIKLQKRLGYNPKNESQELDDQEYINLMFIALIEEAVEFIKETPYKPWKKSMKLNEQNARKEIVDMWHFLINLSLAMGLTPESLYKEFNKKNKMNHRRQVYGY